MRMRFLISAGAASLALCASATAQLLGVGDPAPRLTLGAWLKGEPVTEFQRGSTYVVDFWATWCAPCKRSIPELSALQERFGPSGVRVLGVAVWEDKPSAVAPYIAELGAEIGYSVALDYVLPDARPEQGAMARGWLRAAEEKLLPTTFIVDPAGRVAWIGNPLDAAAPLEQIVAGRWDMERARAAHRQRVEVRRRLGKVQDLLFGAKGPRWQDALHEIDALQAFHPPSEAEVAAYRVWVLFNLGRDEQAYPYAHRIVDGLIKDAPIALNLVAWAIVDPKAPRTMPPDLVLALRVAKRANELSESKNPAILDTLALVHFQLGEFERAVELQELAAARAKGTGWEAEIVQRLAEFRRVLEEHRNSKRSDQK
jgi:thiol-disulfide isomerase/thioredoxin